jgi:hypothetical protein
MSNHYHVVVETVEGNLSQGMRQLNGVYTQTFNRRHRRVGHVFQGRYKAILVERDSYLLELSRYVVLNPVRALMVKDAAEWPWSNYRATIGQARPMKSLQVDWLLCYANLVRIERRRLFGIGISSAPVLDYRPFGGNLNIKFSWVRKRLWKGYKAKFKLNQGT